MSTRTVKVSDVDVDLLGLAPGAVGWAPVRWCERTVRAPSSSWDACIACGDLTTSTPAYCSAACKRADFRRDVRLDKTEEQEE